MGTAAGDRHGEVAWLQRGERPRRGGAVVPLEGAAITAGEHDRLRPGDPLQRGRRGAGDHLHPPDVQALG